MLLMANASNVQQRWEKVLKKNTFLQVQKWRSNFSSDQLSHELHLTAKNDRKNRRNTSSVMEGVALAADESLQVWSGLMDDYTACSRLWLAPLPLLAIKTFCDSNFQVVNIAKISLKQ